MIRFVIKRILWIIPVILGVAFLIFTIMYFTPGDPVELLLGDHPTAEQYEAKRAELGLSDPYLVQLLRFLKETFVNFDLGESYIYGTSIAEEFLSRLPRTAMIAAMVSAMQIVLGIPLGVTAAVHQNGWRDRFCILLAMVSTSIPGFWFAMILILVFSLKLGWLPAYGIGHWYNYILPCLSAGIMGVGGMARQTRSQMLEVIRSDYIVTARSKGLAERTILYKEALPNALIPIITGVGSHFGHALGGTIIIERVFSIPGNGLYMLEAIGNRDYPVIRGVVTILALLYSLVMLIVDLLYAFIDPRIKSQYEGQQKRRIKKNA